LSNWAQSDVRDPVFMIYRDNRTLGKNDNIVGTIMGIFKFILPKWPFIRQ